jgi:hypothetical protein
LTGASIGDQELFHLTRERYENSQISNDNFYVLTETESGEDQIAMVNKDSGTVVKSIALSDESPSYLVDEVNQFVIVNEKNRNLICYKMD